MTTRESNNILVTEAHGTKHMPQMVRTLNKKSEDVTTKSILQLFKP